MLNLFSIDFILSLIVGLFHRMPLLHAPAVVKSFQFSFALCLVMYRCFLSVSLCWVKSEKPLAPNETFLPSTYASYFLLGLLDFFKTTSLILISFRFFSSWSGLCTACW